MVNMNSVEGGLKDNFLDRQKHLNEQLVLIEKSLNKHNNHKESRVPNLEELSGQGQQTSGKIRGFRGRQSLFKRPAPPAPRSNIRVIPDYRKNPSKWTCYSLDDVTDTSNESNSQTAFSFLRELRQRRKRELKGKQTVKDKLRIPWEAMSVEVEGSTSADNDAEVEGSVAEDDDGDEGPKDVISFRKPEKKKVDLIAEDSKPEFRNNKIIMPEYLVGTKRASKKKKPPSNKLNRVDRSKEMKLDHLQAYDDEEV